MLFANTVLSNFNYQKWNCRRGMFNWLKLKMILVRESQFKYRGIKVPCRQFVFFLSKFLSNIGCFLSVLHYVLSNVAFQEEVSEFVFTADFHKDFCWTPTSQLSESWNRLCGDLLQFNDITQQ